jgi:hypothetical protein
MLYIISLFILFSGMHAYGQCSDIGPTNKEVSMCNYCLVHARIEVLHGLFAILHHLIYDSGAHAVRKAIPTVLSGEAPAHYLGHLG